MTASTISSINLDQLAKELMERDLSQDIELPTRFTGTVIYDRNLSEHYHLDDASFVINVLKAAGYTPLQLMVLDNLNRWNFRNSGGILRSAYGLIGASVREMGTGYQVNDDNVIATDTGDLENRFLNESTAVIRRICKAAVASGPHEAKIPLKELNAEFTELSHTSRHKGTQAYKDEQVVLRKLLPMVLSDSPIDHNQPKDDLARKLLIQMARAVSEYRQRDVFGKLRSFLNNCSHLAHLVRMETTGGDTDLNRLSTDVLDQIHCADRLLNSNCVAMSSLLERMIDGEVVYAEILEIGKHQHRVMALEVASCIGLFSYFLTQSKDLISANQDLMECLSRLTKFSDIRARYFNEISSKVS